MSAESFTCPRCLAVSYNVNDIEQGYCGRCHWWTGDEKLAKYVPEDTPAVDRQLIRAMKRGSRRG